MMQKIQLTRAGFFAYQVLIDFRYICLSKISQKMEQQKDYFDNDVPEHLKEIMETKGIHRDILEVRNLKAVTELCVKTTKY